MTKFQKGMCRPPDRKGTLIWRSERRSFGEAAILFARTVVRSPITDSLVKQFVRAATSVGANYCEANDAESKKDFRHKIGLCRKEAKESKHWLRMIAVADSGRQEGARTLWQEAKELNLIFSAIRRKE